MRGTVGGCNIYRRNLPPYYGQMLWPTSASLSPFSLLVLLPPFSLPPHLPCFVSGPSTSCALVVFLSESSALFDLIPFPTNWPALLVRRSFCASPSVRSPPSPFPNHPVPLPPQAETSILSLYAFQIIQTSSAGHAMDRGSASRSRPVHHSRLSTRNNVDKQVQHAAQEAPTKENCRQHRLESSEKQQASDSAVVQRCRQGKRPISFLHAVLVVLLCPYILASIQDTLFFCSGRPVHSSGSFVGAVGALAVPRAEAPAVSGLLASSPITRALQEGVESRKRQQTTFAAAERLSTKGAFDVGSGNGPAENVDEQHVQPQQSVIEVSVVKNALVPGPRWGHTAAFLPESNVVLFVGGQVPSGNDSVVTNDVFAMDLSANSTQQWVQLSSKNLAPHAFAARAVTHRADGNDERLFIIGGSTADCSPNASSVFMWKAGKSWRDGQWSVPDLGNAADLPPRRRGARAMEVPTELGLSGKQAKEAMKKGGSSIMLLGGTLDETTCNRNGSSIYPSADVWTVVAGARPRPGRASRLAKPAPTMSARTLELDARMANMSVVDYSTVLLPSTDGQADRMLLLGGVDVDGSFAPFNQLWVLDLSSGLWTRMDTTNSTATGLDIPLGRVGHTATRTNNGTIIVHGGYISMESDRVPTSDVHVLDYTVTPAVWSKVASTGGSAAPSRAFHTALMAGDIMVVGFGEENEGGDSANPAAANAKQGSTASSSPPVHFLDTANPSGWTWSDSVSDVVTSRVQSESAPAAAPASADAPTDPSSQDVGTDDGKAGETAEDPQSKESQTSDQPAPDAADPAPASDNGGGGVTPKQRNTAVIASVLGAAAIAASLGGLYAAHKRREARAGRDNDSMSGDKYERFSSAATPGPPVSSLWLHSPVAWANSAGKGLRRKASVASEALLNKNRSSQRGPIDGFSPNNSPFSVLSNYSTPEQAVGFQVIRNLPPSSRLSIRRSQLAEQQAVREKLQSQERAEGDATELPDSFLHSILDDNEVRSQNDIRRTVGGGGAVVGGAVAAMAAPHRAVSIVRASSTESLGSLGAASHFSYPYLNAMHRPSLFDMSASSNGSPFSLSLGVTSSPEGPAISPRRALAHGLGYSNSPMTPTWSPAQAQKKSQELKKETEQRQQQRGSFDSLGSDAGDDAAETTVAQRDPKSPSAMIAAAACINSPLFPWAPLTSWGSPMLPAQPAPVLDSRQQSQRRARQSILRVTNQELA